MFGLVGAPKTQAPQKLGLLGRIGQGIQRAGVPGEDGASFLDKLGLIGAKLQDIDGGDNAGQMQEQFSARQQDAERRRALKTKEEEARAMREQLTAAADELGLTGAKKLQFLIDEDFRRQIIAPKRDIRSVGDQIVDVSGDKPFVIYDAPDEAKERPRERGPDGIYELQDDGGWKKVASFGAAPKVFAPQRGGGGRGGKAAAGGGASGMSTQDLLAALRGQ